MASILDIENNFNSVEDFNSKIFDHISMSQSKKEFNKHCRNLKRLLNYREPKDGDLICRLTGLEFCDDLVFNLKLGFYNKRLRRNIQFDFGRVHSDRQRYRVPMRIEKTDYMTAIGIVPKELYSSAYRALQGMYLNNKNEKRYIW